MTQYNVPLTGRLCHSDVQSDRRTSRTIPEGPPAQCCADVCPFGPVETATWQIFMSLSRGNITAGIKACFEFLILANKRVSGIPGRAIF